MNDPHKIKEGDIVRLANVNMSTNRELGIVIGTQPHARPGHIYRVMWSENGLVECWSGDTMETINERQ